MVKETWNVIVILILSFIVLSCKSDDNVVIKEDSFVPKDIPATNTLGVVRYDEGVADGYTLFAIGLNTYLINNCGQVLNKWTSEYRSSHSVYLQNDGSIIRTGRIDNQDFPYAGLGGIIEHISWDNELLWSYQISTTNKSSHHEAFPMPNGNIMVLVAERMIGNKAITAGRDPDLLMNDELYTEKLIEVKPIGSTEGDVVWEWNAWNHLIQDFDSSKDNFGVVANNQHRANINYIDGILNNGADWLHTNSVDYNEVTDQILLSLNGISEYWVIDHSTTTEEAATSFGGNSGKGGDILYRWGNPAVYDKGDVSDQKLFNQHYPYWIPKGYPNEGKIMVFNNRKVFAELGSSVDIIDFPLDYTLNGKGSFGPATSYWTYQDPVDPKNFHSHILSSAQQLINGNILICEGFGGHFFELNTDEEIIWEYINPMNGVDNTPSKQGDAPKFNQVFRVFKYAADHPAFSDKSLIPQDPIELDFDIGNCE